MQLQADLRQSLRESVPHAAGLPPTSLGKLVIG
jgi:hypothetical protein